MTNPDATAIAQTRRPSAGTIALAVGISTVATWSGYASLGGVVAGVFAVGYFGGLLLWLLIPRATPFAPIRAPYWLTLALFILLHKVEENRFAFFERVSDLANTPMPDVLSVPVLLMLGVGFAPWLAVPILLQRSRALGAYLAWTFFASMGCRSWRTASCFPSWSRAATPTSREWPAWLCWRPPPGGACGG